jgi:uncharacterized protein (TIGR00369 family)
MSEGFRELLGLRVDEMHDGTAVVRFDAGERHLNPGGSVHGGAIATLVDTAMGTAVVAAHGDKQGAGTATIEMTVTYLEPAKPGELEARAKVRKVGRRITIVEAEVLQEGDMVAHAIATFTSPTA